MKKYRRNEVKVVAGDHKLGTYLLGGGRLCRTFGKDIPIKGLVCNAELMTEEDDKKVTATRLLGLGILAFLAKKKSTLRVWNLTFKDGTKLMAESNADTWIKIQKMAF